jgi:D-cysteine desulfhydrase
MSPFRHELATLPTPLVRARGLEKALSAGPLYVKRDDLTGFVTAGNKARALEFLIGDAMARRCDLIVAAGSPSSNFCAAAALAAGTAGLECHLLFSGPPPAEPSPNVELARAAGARLFFDAVATRDELDAAVLVHSDEHRAAGRRPYPLPRGGATAIGAVGYAYAARELAEQCARADIAARTVVVATGSGGTQAGLVTGTVGYELPWQVIGASVSRPADDVAERILRIAQGCAAELGVAEPASDDVDVRDLRGAGFGIASDHDRSSAKLALTYEALLLDEYYGAKSMTLFRTLLAGGSPTPAVFWHTGGVVAALAALTRGARV